MTHIRNEKQNATSGFTNIKRQIIRHYYKHFWPINFKSQKKGKFLEKVIKNETRKNIILK